MNGLHKETTHLKKKKMFHLVISVKLAAEKRVSPPPPPISLCISLHKGLLFKVSAVQNPHKKISIIKVYGKLVGLSYVHSSLVNSWLLFIRIYCKTLCKK